MIPITKQGLEKLRLELKKLKSIDRPRVIEAIAAARLNGDLAENEEYDMAREEQGQIETRIAFLEDTIANATVIETHLIKNEKIQFGATVRLFDYTLDKEVSYQIVSDLEIDTSNGQISYKSPLGKALIGRKEGDEIEIIAPRGAKSYEIIKIEYK